jgi:hypothetical protein
MNPLTTIELAALHRADLEAESARARVMPHVPDVPVRVRTAAVLHRIAGIRHIHAAATRPANA